MNDAQDQDFQQPVAYDADGRPLYAHPPKQSTVKPGVGVDSHVTAESTDTHSGHNYDPALRVQYANEPRVVHATRAVEPQDLPLSDEVKERHYASRKRYPQLNLSNGEYVIMSVRRHPIGLLAIVSVAVLLVAIVVFAGIIWYPTVASPSDSSFMPEPEILAIPTYLFALILALGGYIAVWVYLQNQFLLTNESVIQQIQHSLFSRHEQTVSLGSVEDASYRQHGVVQTIFNYGTIRLSTEGDESTYTFTFVERPREQVAVLNNAIESFKNGRPVETTHDFS